MLHNSTATGGWVLLGVGQVQVLWRGSQMAGATPSAKLEHELHLSRLISVVLCAM